VSIIWTTDARDDVDRLVDFVVAYDPGRADEIEQQLIEAPKHLLEFPRRGPRLGEFDPMEVRELRIGKYLLRYALSGADISVLRFFHAREDRFW
jgi:plasmid stabilization system protein ParE